MAITNIALNKTATASGYVKPFAPSMSVDGKYTPINRWLCNGVGTNTPATLTVDLGKPCVITLWVVNHMGTITGWAIPDYNMADFKLQGSLDNASWFDIDSVTGNTASVTSRSITMFTVCRYIRLYVSKGLNVNNQLASVVEFGVYGYTTPYLSGLGLNVNNVVIPMNPTFAPTIFNYTTSNVPYSTSSVNVVTIAQDPTASIKLNNTFVASGASTPIALNVGSNTISVVVTAADGVTTQAYTVTVIREQGATLTGLTISSGTLTPTFSSGTLAYTTQNVGYDTSSVTVTPTTNITGTAIAVNSTAVTSGQAATVNLNVGSNTINIVATNGAASQTYTISVLRASSPYLANVTGIPGITFVKTTYNYSQTVQNATSRIKVKPLAEDTTATTKVNGVVVAYGSSSSFINLAVGTNTITIEVTSASGGDRRMYTFTITRTA